MTALVVPYPVRSVVFSWLPVPSRLMVALVAAVTVLAATLVVVPAATPLVAVSEVQWVNGQSVAVATPDIAGVEFTVVKHTDGVQVLFNIEGPDAPITYRFDNAISDNHTATINATGSSYHH